MNSYFLFFLSSLLHLDIILRYTTVYNTKIPIYINIELKKVTADALFTMEARLKKFTTTNYVDIIWYDYADGTLLVYILDFFSVYSVFYS